MHVRYRWYQIQQPRGSTDLKALINKCVFSNSVQFGFLTLDDINNGPMYRFLWRTSVSITKLDDDGVPIYEQIESVCFNDFALVTIGSIVFLRVENPGRNIRELLNALESLVGMGFVTKPITFEKQNPVTIFKDIDISKLIGLKVVGAVIDKDLVAKMDFISKQGINIENVSILNNIKYTVDLATYELICDGIRGQVTYTTNGLIKISGQLAPKLISIIESDLPNLL